MYFKGGELDRIIGQRIENHPIPASPPPPFAIVVRQDGRIMQILWLNNSFPKCLVPPHTTNKEDNIQESEQTNIDKYRVTAHKII